MESETGQKKRYLMDDIIPGENYTFAHAYASDLLISKGHKLGVEDGQYRTIRAFALKANPTVIFRVEKLHDFPESTATEYNLMGPLTVVFPE